MKNIKWDARIIIGVVMFVTVAVYGMYAMYSIQSNNKSIKDYELLVADLEEQLEEASRIEVLDTGEVTKTLSTVHDAGMKLAKLQNDFRSVSVTATDETYIENAMKIDALLAESDKAARVEWLTIEGEYVWDFKSSYAYSGEKLDVVWLCHPKNDVNAVVAFATATYNNATGLFQNVEYELTGYGQQFVKPDSDGEVDFGDLVDSIGDGNTSDEYVSGGRTNGH